MAAGHSPETDPTAAGTGNGEEGSRPVGAGPARLWAPWRIAYVTEPQPDECIFCTLPADAERPESETLILARYERTYVIMNRYPYNTGHLMVVPHIHRARLQELDADTKSELLDVAGTCMEVIEETLGAQGFNIGFNVGRAAGAGIIDHIHLHVVPRWIGDTNFMPVLGDTKVLSEDLEGTYERLRPILDRITAAE